MLKRKMEKIKRNSTPRTMQVWIQTVFWNLDTLPTPCVWCISAGAPKQCANMHRATDKVRGRRWTHGRVGKHRKQHDRHGWCWAYIVDEVGCTRVDGLRVYNLRYWGIFNNVLRPKRDDYGRCSARLWWCSNGWEARGAVVQGILVGGYHPCVELFRRYRNALKVEGEGVPIGLGISP